MRAINISTVFLYVVFLLLFSVFAQAELSNDVEEFSKEIVNKKVPGPLMLFFGDERINIYIDGTSDVLGFVAEKNVVKSFGLEKVEDPTLIIHVDQQVLEELQTSENGLVTLKDALETKQITYKGVGLKNKIKFSLVSTLSRFTALLSGKSKTLEVKEAKRQDLEKQQEAEKAEKSTEKSLPKEKTKTADAKTDVADANTDVADAKKDENATISDEGDGLTAGSVVDSAKETAKSFGPTGHVVQLVNTGFEVPEITIKAGDTVTWKDVRSNSLTEGMIVGTQKCSKVKSKVFDTGEEFSYTFTESGKCTIVDGIYTTQMMKVIIK